MQGCRRATTNRSRDPAAHTRTKTVLPPPKNGTKGKAWRRRRRAAAEGAAAEGAAAEGARLRRARCLINMKLLG